MPCFRAGGRGAAGSRINPVSKGHEANASSGAQSEALRQTWNPGREQHLGPENQDSQHKLNQPRGSGGPKGERSTPLFTKWGSPKASHSKASHPPHFPRFHVRIFRVFALWNLPDPCFFWGERDFPHFPQLLHIGFESLISKI